MAYQQMYDGVGIAIRSRRPFRFACCDCGLVHRMVIAQGKGGWLGFAVERDRRRTAARRRAAITPQVNRGIQNAE